MTTVSASQRRAADWTSVFSTALQIEGRPAYDLEHVGGGGLLLEGFTQLVEQSRILDGNHSLFCKIRQQFNLLYRKRTDLLAENRYGSDQLVSMEHGHAEHAAEPAQRYG